MADRLSDALEELNRIPVPVIPWSEVERRAESAEASTDVSLVELTSRPPRRGRVMVVVAVAAAVVAGVVMLRSPDDVVRTGPVDQSTTEAVTSPGSWREIAEAPIAPRRDAAAVWTGTEMIVVGGRDGIPCPGSANCPLSGSDLSDGAAYNPVTDEWRVIPPAPAVEIGPAVWAGEQMLVLARQSVESRAVSLLSYSPAEDAWSELASPSTESFPTIALWTGSLMVVPVTSPADGPRTYLSFDPRINQWGTLPSDPLGCSSESTLASSGEDLVAFTIGCRNAATSVPAPMHAAIYDSQDSTWLPLPDTDIPWVGPFVEIDGTLVRAQPGTVDGGDVDPFPQPRPLGGALDTAARTWSTLPPAPTRQGQAPEAVTLEGAAGQWVSAPPYLYSPSTQRWHLITTERPDGGTAGAASVWTGSEIIEWGGADRTWNHFVSTGAAYTLPD